MRRSTDDRGAALPLTLLVLGALVAATALAIDIGRLATTNRDLQSVADLAAIDAVRALDGRPAALQQTTIDQAVTDSATRNGFGSGTTDELDVRLGVLDADGDFVESASTDIPNAVLVEASENVDYLFAPGNRGLDRDAVAARDGMAGITIGSFAASIDASTIPVVGQMLSNQLGGNVVIDLIGYQGLANATVSIEELAVAGGFSLGTADQLLQTEMTAGEIFVLVADAMNARGDVASLAALPGLVELASEASVTETVTLGELLGVAVGDGTRAAGARFGVGDLVNLTADAVSDGHLLSFALPLAIPGVASGTVTAVVLEAPQSVVGSPRSGGSPGAMASTSQIRLRTSVQILGGPGGGVITLPLFVDVAPATAEIVSVDCATDGSTGSVTTEVSAGVASITLGTIDDAGLLAGSSPSSPATILNVLGLARVQASGGVSIAHSPELVEFFPVFDPTNTIRVGGGPIDPDLLVNDLQLTGQLLGLPIPGLLDTVLNQVEALVEPVLLALTPAIETIARSTGIILGGADVTTFWADCGNPRLHR